MDSALCLILLYLSVVMISGNGFTVSQPERLEGLIGKSINIPCSFTYPETHKPRKINICWRRNEFHGEFIFNLSRRYTHPHYFGQIDFLGSPYQENTGTIRINHLKQHDQNRYFCRVEITGNYNEQWQSITGTFLTVRDLTLVRTSTAKMIETTVRDTHGQQVGKGKKASSRDLVLIGCSVGVLLLIALGLVAAICIWRKKRKQQRGNIGQVDKEDILALNDNPAKKRDQRQTGRRIRRNCLRILTTERKPNSEKGSHTARQQYVICNREVSG
ncbi:paired immunoglobulin-like type 2 receptor beta isoform X2 [Carcharodon carcharias]|uniref:paired immunoglobulin-like type 2 receptor beta isoform X2 n=1 Tax=Carcharodon carcharias TaxID=13397 RepID=UPI001B7DE8AD|nr:paired immunoglobulin-like type 2 receptor beta isoform X2 [Carcharodon carcharias]